MLTSSEGFVRFTFIFCHLSNTAPAISPAKSVDEYLCSPLLSTFIAKFDGSFTVPIRFFIVLNISSFLLELKEASKFSNFRFFQCCLMGSEASTKKGCTHKQSPTSINVFFFVRQNHNISIKSI